VLKAAGCDAQRHGDHDCADGDHLPSLREPLQGSKPIFALAFVRHVLDGKELVEVNPLFKRSPREGFYSEDLMKRIAERGTSRTREVPSEIRKLFVTAHEITRRITSGCRRHFKNTRTMRLEDGQLSPRSLGG